jgi:hypothetical protein
MANLPPEIYEFIAYIRYEKPPSDDPTMILYQEIVPASRPSPPEEAELRKLAHQNDMQVDFAISRTISEDAAHNTILHYQAFGSPAAQSVINRLEQTHPDFNKFIKDAWKTA